MLETQQRTRSSQRYPTGKILPSNLPKGHSHATFYSKGKERRAEADGQSSSKVKSIKEFIDVYFEEEAKSHNRMPLIGRRAMPFESRKLSERKGKNKAEEDLSKSVAIDNPSQMPQNLMPMTTALRWSVSAMEQLPSIHEQTEGVQDDKQQMAVLNQTSNLSFLKKASSLYSDLNPEGQGNEQRMLTFENELFCVYVQIREGKPVGRVKEYKDRGLPFMEREGRMKNYGVVSLWRESRYNHRSFAISLRPPIKDQILRIMPDEVNPAQLKIKQKTLHIRLLANHSQELCLLLRNLCLELKKVEGRVLNNKINPANLFLRSSGLHLAEWGYSSFREEFTIREGHFEKRRYGVLRGDDWFVSPQYLAPQIIRQLLGQDVDVWGEKGSADIWSLGLTFFEMVTMIPIWVNAKCSLIHRPAIVRNGVLSAPGRDLQLLQKKQVSVQKTIKRLLASQTTESQQNQRLFSVIVRMVEPDLSKRISLDEILTSL